MCVCRCNACVYVGACMRAQTPSCMHIHTCVIRSRDGRMEVFASCTCTCNCHTLTAYLSTHILMQSLHTDHILNHTLPQSSHFDYILNHTLTHAYITFLLHTIQSGEGHNNQHIFTAHLHMQSDIFTAHLHMQSAHIYCTLTHAISTYLLHTYT